MQSRIEDAVLENIQLLQPISTYFSVPQAVEINIELTTGRGSASQRYSFHEDESEVK